MTGADFTWNSDLASDIRIGFLGSPTGVPGHHTPHVVLNEGDSNVQHSLVQELERANTFTFSVAFVSASAIAQLKQHLLDFGGTGTIITSDYLGFNSPDAFAELLNLRKHLGINVRRHNAQGFHPKGYLFEGDRAITAIVGSANLTENALSKNYELNLRVSAAHESDLAHQLRRVIADQITDSVPLTHEWLEQYAATYVPPAPRAPAPLPVTLPGQLPVEGITPNEMQQDALLELDFVRAEGHQRAIIISATGTGKTMLSALDVRAFDPNRMLFVVHREQILERTIREYKRVLGGPDTDYGLLTGNVKQHDRRYVFATIQTLSQEGILGQIDPEAFDYVIIDEAHHAGAPTYKRVIDHLTPRFLLGMTATPERTDGFNVYELFDYNVPYEIRLGKALESEMLCPFHYYGIADYTFDDGETTTDNSPLGVLITPERVRHLVKALDLYGQAGAAPRGLIFCSRVDEARELSRALNECELRGERLRTVALSAADPMDVRTARVEELERGELDYILTVDAFNEGVDIPSINQVIMLRQTQSAIVFVQQLGRGLRLAPNKDYLVVIDFIGNYATNFLIPVALFGDESLNKESLREKLNETVEGGALPGLSSVSFDKISRDRILESIGSTKLDSNANLKNALIAMRNRVGGVPQLWDFYRFGSVDPVVLATRDKMHFPALVESLLQVKHGFTPDESRALALLSNEVLAAKRLQEFVLMELLLANGSVAEAEIGPAFSAAGLRADEVSVRSAIDTFTLDGYPQSDKKRYQVGIAELADGRLSLTPAFVGFYTSNHGFKASVDDLLHTGEVLTRDRYPSETLFTPGMQYSRRDAARFLGWPRATASTIYGVKVDDTLGVCALFITLHKSDDVAAGIAYEDRILDQTTMRWFSKSNRTLQSGDVRPIVENSVSIHVFVKKDDADGSDHYYLGQATAHDAMETTMPGEKGALLPVVVMNLKFETPIRQGLFDYFHSKQARYLPELPASSAQDR